MRIAPLSIFCGCVLGGTSTNYSDALQASAEGVEACAGGAIAVTVVTNHADVSARLVGGGGDEVPLEVEAAEGGV